MATKFKKIGKWIFIILVVIIVLLILIVVIFNSIENSTTTYKLQKPNLVLLYDGETQFRLTQGCFSTIKGKMKNTGDATAHDVIIMCGTLNQNGLMGKNEKNLGQIFVNQESPFEMKIDVPCLKSTQGVSYQCEATCSNC